MTDADTIRETVQEIPPGTDVRLELKDGTDVTRTLAGTDAAGIHLEGRDDKVELGQVEGVLLGSIFAGPE